MKICREYLNHIQNSVFEGDISISNYKELLSRIKNIADFSVDSIIIFKFRKNTLFKKEILGCKNSKISNII